MTTPSPDPLALLTRAGAQFARVLDDVPADAWDDATPCADWSVRELVNHVVTGEVMTAVLLRDGTRDDAMALFGDDRLGDDPRAAFADAHGDAVAAYRADGALDRVMAHPMGDLPAAVVLGFRIGDLTLHAWDLARAVGGDETLDPVLVEAVWQTVEPLGDGIAAVGVFGEGPSGTVDADAPLQTRLLDLTGRRP